MKTVLVVGASSVIGGAVVTALWPEYAVIGTYRSEPAPEVPSDVQLIKMDLDPGDHTFVGPATPMIHGMVNCAGVSIPGDLLEYGPEDWRTTLAVNLTAPLHLSAFAAANMIAHGIRGSIINMGSFGATLPAVGSGAYAASKAGLVSLTRSMADEWGHHGIRVNCVSPGTVPSPMTTYHIRESMPELLKSIALKRLAEASEVANVVRFLLEDTYITGEDIKVTGGKFLTQGIGREE
jgi:NAD(P)-dependent dehydrogenase (short-subunit alcohol dehydrogenase family)